MYKAAVRHGDPTTTSGVVLAYTSTIFDDHKQVAIRGDKATCGNCKGSFHIAATGDDMTDDGKPVVLDGDLVLCPCKKNRVIVGNDPGIFIELCGGGAANAQAARTQKAVPIGAPPGLYDEQFQLLDTHTSRPLANVEYVIERASGDMEHGVTDANGHTHRLSKTDLAEEINIYCNGAEHA
ncbi:MAG TPA: PAAR domain-containing protein [Paraburkholderia sp.]|nr:PAAR domain-containing protein [Paraburkholderia sp.]